MKKLALAALLLVAGCDLTGALNQYCDNHPGACDGGVADAGAGGGTGGGVVGGGAQDGGDDAGTSHDAGFDGGSRPDAGADAGGGFDAGLDAGSPPDAGFDAGSALDAGVDGGTDAGVDREWAAWPLPPATTLGTNYTNLGNGTVRDVTTGLLWQQDSSAQMNWPSAVTYCAGLAQGGLSWRMPTMIELTSIVDYARYAPSVAPPFNTSYLATPFWTSTPAVADPTNFRWFVELDHGASGYDLVTTSTYRVRCVQR